VASDCGDMRCEAAVVLALAALAAAAKGVSSSYDTSMVNRLLADRKMLIQDGLSYFNGTTIKDVLNRWVRKQ